MLDSDQGQGIIVCFGDVALKEGMLDVEFHSKLCL
jgi:hypothetical protein